MCGRRDCFEKYSALIYACMKSMDDIVVKIFDKFKYKCFTDTTTYSDALYHLCNTKNVKMINILLDTFDIKLNKKSIQKCTKSMKDDKKIIEKIKTKKESNGWFF